MTYLNAMVAVGKVIHGLVLFVDNANTGFVCTDSHRCDVLGGNSTSFQLSMKFLGGFNGGLGMKLGCGYIQLVLVE